MSKTIIKYAKELVAEKGEEIAIKIFENRIKRLGKPKNFEEICKVSGWETAIQYIKGEI
jgi:hypothetical protein